MESTYDLIIVGAGPAGLSAALSAQKNQLNYILLEKTDHLADTVHCYQKGKRVMAEPTVIPSRGELWLEQSLRENVLDRWGEAARRAGLNIALDQPVTEIRQENGSFAVRTHTHVFEVGKVIIAIGTQGNPRKLNVPGESLPHVLPRLTDPDLYAGRDIVVVGGGDSAIEIAVALAKQNQVTMSVRSSEFIRAKDSLTNQALDLAKKGQMTIYFNSTVERIDPDSVTLKLPASTASVKAEWVFVKIGTTPPREFLESCGIPFPSKDPEATPKLSRSYKTAVPGLFLIGAVSGRGDLIKHAINQGYEVIEHICGREVEPADEDLLRKKLHFLPGTVSQRIKALVAKAPLFSEGREEDIRELLLFSQFHRLPAGQEVFHQHDFSQSLYVIREGSVNVIRVEPGEKTDEGEETIVATRGPGEFFGEMSLISGRRRSATVRVASEASLWEIDRKAMLKFIHLTPSAKQAIDETYLIRAFQSYLVPELDDADLAQLANKAKVLTCEKGKVIIRQGDPGDAFYFLRSGMVKVSQMRDGREIVLAYLAAGQYFGETALLSDEPKIASVSAIDKVEVIQLLKDDFRPLLGKYPDLKKRVEEERKSRRLNNIKRGLWPGPPDEKQIAEGQGIGVVGDNVLLIDENLCIHCDNCVKACEGVHADGQTRLKRTGIKFANILVANSCQHCENPLCMTDCPPGDAIARDPRGEVYIKENCIGCGNCAANCPYDAIFMVHPKEHPKEKWSFFQRWTDKLGIHTPKKEEPGKSLVVKCDLCRGLDGGPACVRGCPTGAVLRVGPEDYHQTIDRLVRERKGAA